MSRGNLWKVNPHRGLGHIITSMNMLEWTLEVLIIGGGLSGLGAGYKLSQEGFKVTVLEGRNIIGGMASSYRIEHCYIPKTYHHIMSDDETTIDLINELNLQDSLYWKRLSTAFLYHKKRYDFSSPLDILKFEPLSFMDRVRFGLLVWRARRRKDWMFLDSINVKDWVSENYGESLYDNLVKHIVTCKFAEPPENISVAWLLSRFGHESKSISGNFGYIKNGGIQRIIDGLAEGIRRNNGEIKTQTEVVNIKIEDRKALGVVYGRDRKILTSDVIISTVPTPVLASMSLDLPKATIEQLTELKYKASICITLGLKKKLSKYYWLNVIGDYPFVGVFEHKHLNTDPSPKGITYLVKYLDQNHPDWICSDEEIVEMYLPRLEEVFPTISDQVLWARVYREPFSTPVYSVNFGKNMPDLRSPIRNFYITGISRIYPKDRYMGTALSSGFEAARAVVQDYKTT
jgi:protoporphyrinogen oxidase